MQRADDSHIIMFKHIASAHSNALKVISDLIHKRAISEQYSWVPSYISHYVPSSFAQKKTDFSGVIFVAVHNCGLFENQMLSANQISNMVCHHFSSLPTLSSPVLY